MLNTDVRREVGFNLEVLFSDTVVISQYDISLLIDLN